ncbi:MAG TPA: hypothetical protein PKH77_20240 [Anaerolineae bacterium]|nr:hypothetical protein [Anaerolineae bacterium]
MKPKQQAAVLRQVAAELEQGKCSQGLLSAILTGLFGSSEPSATRGSGKKSATNKKKR